jgi:ribonuclease P protein component
VGNERLIGTANPGHGDDMPQYGFPKQNRLLAKPEFDRVFALRTSAADPFVVMYAMPNELKRPRLGLVVSRKVGNAVVRNRWKRLLREAFRLSQHELPSLDFVCLPRPQATPSTAQLARSLSQLSARLTKKFAARDRAEPRQP